MSERRVLTKQTLGSFGLTYGINRRALPRWRRRLKDGWRIPGGRWMAYLGSLMLWCVMHTTCMGPLFHRTIMKRWKRFFRLKRRKGAFLGCSSLFWWVAFSDDGLFALPMI